MQAVRNTLNRSATAGVKTCAQRAGDAADQIAFRDPVFFGDKLRMHPDSDQQKTVAWLPVRTFFDRQPAGCAYVLLQEQADPAQWNRSIGKSGPSPVALGMHAAFCKRRNGNVCHDVGDHVPNSFSP